MIFLPWIVFALGILSMIWQGYASKKRVANLRASRRAEVNALKQLKRTSRTRESD